MDGSLLIIGFRHVHCSPFIILILILLLSLLETFFFFWFYESELAFNDTVLPLFFFHLIGKSDQPDVVRDCSFAILVYSYKSTIRCSL